MKNRLVFRQTSKETVEALGWEGPRQGKDVVGFPRFAGKPRAPSLVGMNNMRVEEEDKRVRVEIVD
jgi:hypothetical protein